MSVESRAAPRRRVFWILAVITALLVAGGGAFAVHRGETVSFAVHNGLPEATSRHWHGAHLPPAMHGGPHQQVRPGSTCPTATGSTTCR